eukprot:Awhi_evm1s14806
MSFSPHTNVFTTTALHSYSHSSQRRALPVERISSAAIRMVKYIETMIQLSPQVIDTLKIHHLEDAYSLTTKVFQKNEPLCHVVNNKSLHLFFRSYDSVFRKSIEKGLCVGAWNKQGKLIGCSFVLEWEDYLQVCPTMSKGENLYDI